MQDDPSFVLIPLKRKLKVTHLVSLFHYKYPTKYSFEGEQHNFWELIFVDQGVLEISRNNETFRLTAGQIAFHKPNEFHALRTVTSQVTSAIICSFVCDDPLMNFFEGYVSGIHNKERLFLTEMVYLRSQFFFNASVPFRSIPKPLESIPELYLQLVQNYLELLLTEILVLNKYHIGTTDGLTENEPSNAPSSLTQNVIAYLEQNIYNKLTLQQISTAVNYSIPHTKRIFHQDMKQGIIDYFFKLKIDEAKRMIHSGDYTISQISDLLSFNDPAYFCRKFKQYEGITPSDFKRSLKKGSETEF